MNENTQLLHEIDKKLIRTVTLLEATVEQKDDHESRIRVLEGSRWKLMGFMSAISIFWGTAVALLTKVLFDG